MAELILEELDDEDLKDEIRKLRAATEAEVRKRAKRDAEFERHVSSASPASRPGAAVASSSSAGEGSHVRQPMLVTSRAQAYSAAEASK